MKFIKSNFLIAAFALVTLAFVSCEKDTASGSSLSNYVGMESVKYVAIPKDESATVDAKIYASDVSNVDRIFTLVVDPLTTQDPSYYTLPATVTIPAGQKVGVYQVGITATNLGAGKLIVVGLEPVEGVHYGEVSNTTVIPPNQPGGAQEGFADVVTNSKTKIIIEEKCDFNKVALSITFDNYPEETAWELDDSTGAVIASGGLDDTGTITGYAALGFADQSTFATNFCLPAGDYTFKIYDDYGDGMFTSTAIQGSYSVKFGETVLATGGGDFGAEEDTTFTLP